MKKIDRCGERVCVGLATFESLRAAISGTKWELWPSRNESLDKMPLLGHKQAQR